MKSNILNKLNALPYFSKTALRGLVGENENTLNQSIKRLLESGVLIPIKKGSYVTRSFYEIYKNDSDYAEFIAYVIKPSSYLSLDYVLAKHDVLTNAVYGYYSVTTNGPYKFSNAFGEYVYKSISPKLFTGYEEKFFLSNKYYVAKKSKALFDYLYFRSSMLRSLRMNHIEELRLNLSSFTKADIRGLKSYSKLTDNRDVRKAVERICHEYGNNRS